MAIYISLRLALPLAEIVFKPTTWLEVDVRTTAPEAFEHKFKVMQ